MTADITADDDECGHRRSAKNSPRRKAYCKPNSDHCRGHSKGYIASPNLINSDRLDSKRSRNRPNISSKEVASSYEHISFYSVFVFANACG